MTANFTPEDVVAKVRSLAAARPDFVYEPPTYVNPNTPGPSCHYVHVQTTEDGVYLTGGCIVGQALIALGMDSADLHEYDNGSGANGSTVVIEQIGSVENRKALYWLDRVQNRQDNGGTWAEAVEEADADHPLD